MNRTSRAGRAKERGRFVWVSVAAFLAVVSAVSWMNTVAVQRHLQSYRRNHDVLQTEMDTLRQHIEALAELASRQPGLTARELESLRRKGLTDPPTDIAADLCSRADLIPFEGVLGGTMAFYDVHVLNSKWVLGHFEDGHVAGHMLLEYSVSDSGKISWRSLAAYMD